MTISDKPKSIRLTPPQIELLTDIATNPEYFIRRFSRWEKTAHVLCREGLATTWSEGPSHFGIRITDAGRTEAARRGIGHAGGAA